ncbi:MAG: hypothetical protein Q7S19_00480 [bacterium]|nr:hypothetical protein [bacterium]
MRIRFFKIFFIIALVLPQFSYAIETLKNTGLIPSTLWYSKDPFYTGDKVRIYSVIFNGSNKDLRGKIVFYNSKNSLCTSDFSSLSGRVSEVWCDWTVPAGRNSISVKIINPRASAPGEEEQDVILAHSELTVSERIAVEAPKPVVIENNPLHHPPAGENEKATGFVNEGVNLIRKIVDFVNPPDEAPVVSVKTETDTHKPASMSSHLALPDGKANIKQKSEYRNLTGIYPALVAIKDTFYDFTASVAARVLPKLKSFSETDSRPLAMTLSFFYGLVKFIFDYPLVFASIILASIWKLFDLIFRRREGF